MIVDTENGLKLRVDKKQKLQLQFIILKIVSKSMITRWLKIDWKWYGKKMCKNIKSALSSNSLIKALLVSVIQMKLSESRIETIFVEEFLSILETTSSIDEIRNDYMLIIVFTLYSG